MSKARITFTRYIPETCAWEVEIPDNMSVPEFIDQEVGEWTDQGDWQLNTALIEPMLIWTRYASSHTLIADHYTYEYTNE